MSIFSTMVDYIPRAYTFVVFVFLSVPSFGAASHLRSSTHTEPDNGGDGTIRRGRYLPADPSSELIPDEFMVTLGKDVDVQSSMDDLLAECPGAEILYVYEVVLNGFAVKVDTDCMGQWFEGHSGVIETVEESSVVHAGEVETWGLDRIDQRYGLDGQMYGNPEVNGEGVDIYIIDTGVRKTHEEFTNRVKSGFNVMGYGDINDDNGHGTHVAGTAAGIRYGVAKAAHIIPIKVLNSYGSGSWSGVARGIDIATVEFLKSKKPSVINMSIQGGKSILVNNAIQASSDAGVVVVVAASNYNRDACNYSPASAPSAITVAATWRDDSRSSYSSWGSCVDIFAPGSDITSAWRTSDTATRVLSGTSMASPHVAGAAALVLGEEPDKTPAQVASDLIEMATPNAVIDAMGSPNKLLFVGDIMPGVVSQVEFCCTVGFNTCLEEFCNHSSDVCLGITSPSNPNGQSCGDDSFWFPFVPDPNPTSCLVRDSGCTSSDDCCSVLECIEREQGDGVMVCDVPPALLTFPNSRIGLPNIFGNP